MYFSNEVSMSFFLCLKGIMRFINKITDVLALCLACFKKME